MVGDRILRVGASFNHSHPKDLVQNVCKYQLTGSYERQQINKENINKNKELTLLTSGEMQFHSMSVVVPLISFILKHDTIVHRPATCTSHMRVKRGHCDLIRQKQPLVKTYQNAAEGSKSNM